MRLDRKISSLELLTYRHYRIVHGVRIGLAFILTFLLIRLLAVPAPRPLITGGGDGADLVLGQCVCSGRCNALPARCAPPRV